MTVNLFSDGWCFLKCALNSHGKSMSERGLYWQIKWSRCELGIVGYIKGVVNLFAWTNECDKCGLRRVLETDRGKWGGVDRAMMSAARVHMCVCKKKKIKVRDRTLSEGTSLTARSILSDPKLSFFSHYQRVWKKKWGKNEGWIRLHAWMHTHWMIPSLTVQSKVHVVLQVLNTHFSSRTKTIQLFIIDFFLCVRTFWETLQVKVMN